MRNFWPSFFAFLIAVVLMIGFFRTDLMDRALDFLGWYLMLLGYVALGTLIMAAGVGAAIFFRAQRLKETRPVDGAFPLQRYRLENGRTLIVNPNTMIGPAAIVDRREGYREWEHPAGWDVVVRIREMVERANMVRAMFPGDSARQNRFGSTSEPPRLSAGSWKTLDTKLGPSPKQPRIIGEPVAPSIPTPQACAISLTDAMQQNSSTRLAVGQTAAGDLVRWDVTQYPHARFHGASQGSGKTNAAKTVLVGMAQQGAHVVILDRRRFKDFRGFNGKAELIDTSNPAHFVDALKRLEQIYRQRDQLLGQYGAANIDELPQRLVRYVVMVTEFGTLCAVADGDGLLRDAMRPLANIMREAGAAGIHLIFEDQVVERGKWPRGVAANAGGVFTGYLPLNLGAAGGYHHAHQLEKYHFHHDGQIFRTWDTRPALRQLLAATPAYDARLAVLDGVATAVGEGERSTPPPPATAGNGWNGNNGTEDPSYWDDVVAAWFAANPRALTGPASGISDLARAMCMHQTGKTDDYESYKSRAHRCYHTFRKSVYVNGDPLGTDVTK